jgi:hypothetical protein
MGRLGSNVFQNKSCCHLRHSLHCTYSDLAKFCDCLNTFLRRAARLSAATVIMLISPSRKSHEPPMPAEEVSRLLHLIDQVHGGSVQPAAEYTNPQHATPLPDDKRDGIRLPGLSALFPAYSSGRNRGVSSYPTPMSSDTSFSPINNSPGHTSPHVLPEQQAMSTHLDAVRRGFAFHRKCNHFVFVAYDDTQAERLLENFKSIIADGGPRTEIKTCELFSVGVIAAIFNRVEIPAEIGDLFYKVASERIGNWVLSQPLTAMRCCALLGLANLFQKATVSLLYFGGRTNFNLRLDLPLLTCPSRSCIGSC